MEHNNRVQFPRYLKRKLIYEAKRFGPFKCRIEFKSTGIAEIISYQNSSRDVNGAKSLLKQIIEEQKLVYEADLKEFKQNLTDPQVISDADLDVSKEVDFDPMNHKPTQVASYLTNYAAATPYIVVPASPGVYNKPILPLDITPTTSSDDRTLPDVNKSLFKHPLEPMLIACQNLIQDFSLANYDILTDRNNLRKLLSWAMQEEQALCRIDIELHDGCLVLRRCDEEQAESNIVTHSSASLFEQKCVNKPSHVAYHIIGSFKLGNNRVLMRYEVDGQMPPKKPEEDELAAKLKGTSLNETKRQKFQGSDVPFIAKGTQQEQLEYVEVKSFMKDRYDLNDPKLKSELSSIYFQSFIVGINHFVFGLKETVFKGRGQKNLNVTKIVTETLESIGSHVDIKQIVAGMKKVIALLNYVQLKMKDGIEKAALLYDPQSDQLLFYNRKGDPLIPPHFPFSK